MANSIVVVLPVSTAPAARSRATTGESTYGTDHSAGSALLCAVVGPSRVATMSFTPIGMP